MNSLFSRDNQLKAIESLLNDSEKYLGQFCTTLASYTRKTAKLRDKADFLVRQLNEFASNEDPELRTCMKNLAEDLAMVQDYRQAEVERLEARVVTPLKAYGDTVKIKRADLKRFNADRNREMKELQKLEKIRLKNPADRQSISQAEVIAQKATNNANRSTRQMEETISEFQRQKLEDVKKVFSEFIMVEMLFHAKALEVYTHTFQNFETMDIDKDLELFMRKIQVTDLPLDNQVLQSVRSTSSSPPYSSPTPSTLRKTADYFTRSRRSTLRRQDDIEDEDNEEEDEEEEDVYESEGPYEEPQTLRESYAAQYSRVRRPT
ncbi:CBY1-interacting BAR domain-containing protein 2 [Clupea harengus]|uniref:CBY1-interacting BAR domain-containing protein 2 n=1 Tax=Clupea harengus TaxID=7950 RepID=A0A6P3VKE4_CLUHA|nr:CBY1-interacting BAR domain-containing protein 2 [Clupea harengus]